MTIAHLLEDFSASGQEGELKLMSEEMLEDQRLASFEQGYGAGWEDAVDAQARDQDTLAERAVQALEDMSFGYHEAHGQMVETLAPLFQELVGTVLPEALRETLGLHLVEQLTEMSMLALDQPAYLMVPKHTAASLAPVLEDCLSMQVHIREDPSLEPGRAYLRLGETEREVNSARLLDAIRENVDAFIHHSAEAGKHA